jgi:hypothetical protein
MHPGSARIIGGGRVFTIAGWVSIITAAFVESIRSGAVCIAPTEGRALL